MSRFGFDFVVSTLLNVKFSYAQMGNKFKQTLDINQPTTKHEGHIFGHKL